VVVVLLWIEPISGLLKVGPNSAGAMPGPACYDIGGTERDSDWTPILYWGI